MTRHIGAFILNTLIPLIDRIEKLLEKHPDALEYLPVLLRHEVQKITIYCITTMAITAIVCATFLGLIK